MASLLQTRHDVARLEPEARQDLIMILPSSRVVWKDREGLIDIFMSFLEGAPHRFYVAQPVPGARITGPFHEHGTENRLGLIEGGLGPGEIP